MKTKVLKVLHPSAIVFALAMLVGLQVLSAGASAQVTAEKLSKVSTLSQLQSIALESMLKLDDQWIIEGIQPFDSWFIVTDQLIFKPDAQLVFSRQALNKRRNFFIVAGEIISEDANAPGVITYEHGIASNEDTRLGQAATGRHGQSHGQHGETGAPGAPGITGAQGEAAPSLTIVTLRVPTSGPAVDFRGGPGGDGGQGQTGGDGGNGATGLYAAQNIYKCVRRPQRGGNGGDGGIGGPGGAGGAGGTGGTVTILAPEELLASLTQKFRIDVSSGHPGAPGGPGIGGVGGLGGRGGAKAPPFCPRNAPRGANGQQGESGEAGRMGDSGVQGDLFVGAITVEHFQRIY